MTEKTINAFISSANREINENVYNFTVKFANDIIICNENQYIKINVVSFDMLNTMYNINSTNNSFYILEYNENDVFVSSTLIQIPYGNYSVATLKSWLNNNIGTVINVVYNTAQNTFTFTKVISDTNKYYISIINCSKFLGLTGNNYITTSGLTGSYVNMVNYSKIILRATNINYDIGCIENVSSGTNKLSFSDILFWKSKQDIEPFRNISYSNEDSGSSFNVLIHDKQISYINLQLTNEFGTLITDATDYLLVLQFTIYNKDDWIKESVLSITQSVKQIWVSILWLMENYLKII